MEVSPTNGPTVVLVHGAWADGSSWGRVIPLLMKKGVPVVAVQNPTTSLAHITDDGAGFLKLSVEGWIKDVAQDLPEDKARVLAIVQPPLAASTFGDKITKAAWRTRPNWYVVSIEDRIVSVELERRLAATLKAKTTELKAGRLSLLSQPEAVAEVILDAVTTVAAGA